AWRYPGFKYNEPNLGAYGSNFQMYLESAREAENAKFDILLFGDVAVRSTDPVEILSCQSKYDMLEPLSLIAALAVTTRHIGLAATASTTYNEPYHVARRFASIDHLSGGRASWN